MKKILFSILIGLTVLLTACSSSASTPAGSTGNDLPIETQLAVGTLKLAGTDQDISAGQAKELVVYWQVYKELSQSETAAQSEIDGLVVQIQETLTDDQMQAITGMKITQQDVFASMQGVSVISSNSSDSAGSAPSGSGGMPAGGPPADGGSAPPDGGMPADMGGAAPASGADSSQSAAAGSGLAGTAGVPSALVQAVIDALQQKIAS